MKDEDTDKNKDSIRNIRRIWLSMGYDDPAIFSDIETLEGIDSEVAQ